jgi:phytoene synthase
MSSVAVEHTSTNPSHLKLAEAYAAADTLARNAAGNFYYSFRVLSTEKKRAMTALYAFLSELDAIGDDDDSVAEKRLRLSQWRHDLEKTLIGYPGGPQPWWPAFADVIRRYQLPEHLLWAAIDGIERDLELHEYRHFADLYRYCYCVASAVGMLCIRIWGTSSQDADLPAEYLGVAFQLTNILRDVVEDGGRGRCYIPLDTLHRFGVQDIHSKPQGAAWKNVIAFEAERAARYFSLGKPVAQFLSPEGRASLAAMIGIYEGILNRIRARPEIVFEGRVRIPTWKKLLIAGAALRHRLGFLAPLAPRNSSAR